MNEVPGSTDWWHDRHDEREAEVARLTRELAASEAARVAWKSTARCYIKSFKPAQQERDAAILRAKQAETSIDCSVNNGWMGEVECQIDIDPACWKHKLEQAARELAKAKHELNWLYGECKRILGLPEDAAPSPVIDALHALVRGNEKLLRVAERVMGLLWQVDHKGRGTVAITRYLQDKRPPLGKHVSGGKYALEVALGKHD